MSSIVPKSNSNRHSGRTGTGTISMEIPLCWSKDQQTSHACQMAPLDRRVSWTTIHPSSGLVVAQQSEVSLGSLALAASQRTKQTNKQTKSAPFGLWHMIYGTLVKPTDLDWSDLTNKPIPNLPHLCQVSSSSLSAIFPSPTLLSKISHWSRCGHRPHRPWPPATSNATPTS